MEKIDFVVTWVNGNDLEWQREYLKYSAINDGGDSRIVRYRSWDNFKYWFRGVEKFAPWVRKVFLVTEGHIPDWLNLDNEKLVVVKHSEIMPTDHLPTFNSCAIEVNLHKIPGLSEQFVYFNDDIFITNYLTSDFFFKNGLPCEVAVFNALSGGATDNAVLEGVKILNKYFNKRTVLRENPCKWFNYIYGKELIRTILLLPWPNFTGFYEPHTPMPFLKSTFRELWEKEPDILMKTSSSKFRTDGTVNPYLFKYWQLVSGQFNPSGYFKKCAYFEIKERSISSICYYIENRKKRILILNDSDKIVNFESLKNKIIQSFDKILWEKSTFEIHL